MGDPKEEVEALMNEGFGFAEKMLSDHGEFHPFGVALTKGGEIRHVAAWDGRELPPGRELAELLANGLRETVAEYEAVAMFMNVTVRAAPGGSGRDAVQAALEHLSGYAVDVFLPYRIENGEVLVEPVFASRRLPSVFNVSGGVA